MNPMEDWQPFRSGASVGERGSEDGIILQDDEHVGGARITLEHGGHTAPFSITCGIYGMMVHTRFFSDEAHARVQYLEMRSAIGVILQLLAADGTNEDAAVAACSSFVERFP